MSIEDFIVDDERGNLFIALNTKKWRKIMSASAITGQSRMNLHHNEKRGWMGEYSFSLSNIPKNISKYAVPAILLYSLANIPGAEGGPMAYALCVEACFAGTSWWCPPLIPACVAACLPLLTVPTP